MTLPIGTAYIREIYRKYRKSAKRRGLYFRLSMDDFRSLVVQNCHYCGEAPRKLFSTKSQHKFPLNGVDRMDSSLGYSVDNCVPACSLCNMVKGNRKKEEFLEHARKVYEQTKDLLKKT